LHRTPPDRRPGPPELRKVQEAAVLASLVRDLIAAPEEDHEAIIRERVARVRESLGRHAGRRVERAARSGLRRAEHLETARALDAVASAGEAAGYSAADWRRSAERHRAAARRPAVPAVRRTLARLRRVRPSRPRRRPRSAHTARRGNRTRGPDGGDGDDRDDLAGGSRPPDWRERASQVIRAELDADRAWRESEPRWRS